MIIFDFDGTIANTLPVAVGLLNRLSHAFGYEKVTDEDLETLRGLTFKDLRKYLKLSWIELPLFVYRVRQQMYQQIGLLKPVFGMEDMLAELKHREIRMGVVSSNDEKVLRVFLDKYFPNYFDFVQGNVSLFRKDKVLDKLVQTRGLEKKQTVYVGDEVRDIEAAHKSEIQIISVTWGLQSRVLLEQYQPAFLVDNPQDLLKVISQLTN